jgi:acyl-CoA thioester hydrolase
VAPFRYRLRVRYHECDAQGIVYNANYLTYHDIAITELWREAFGSWNTFVADSGVDMVVAEANVRYLAAARFDDEIDLLVTVPKLGTTSVTIASRLERGGDAIAEVELRYVVVDPGTHAKTAIPQPVRDALQPYAG